MQIDFLKEIFRDTLDGVVFSMPSELFHTNSEVPPITSLVSLMEEVCQRAAQPPVDEDFGQHVFFRLLATRPELEKSLLPPHLNVRRSLVVVGTMDVVRAQGTQVAVTSSSAKQVHLDLALICSPSNISRVFRWRTHKHKCTPAVSNELRFQLEQENDFFNVPAPAPNLSIEDDTPLTEVLQAQEGKQILPFRRVTDVGLADKVVTSFFQKQAVAGSAVSVPVASFGSSSACSAGFMQRMIDHGILEANDTSTELQLRVDKLDWKLHTGLHAPVDLWHCEAQKLCPNIQRNKISMVCHLLRFGWKPSEDDIDEYKIGDFKRFPMDSFVRPGSFLLCLCAASAIFDKGLDCILFGKCDGYYKCLLKKPDLRNFHSTPGFANLSNRQFQAYAVGNIEDEAADVPVPLLALEDGEVEPAQEPMQVEGLHAILAPSVAVYALQPIKFQHTVGLLTVIFDNYSSGAKRRAICHCKYPGHVSEVGRCERAVYVEDFPSHTDAACFLLAWASSAASHSGKEEHIAAEPNPGDVAAISEFLAR